MYRLINIIIYSNNHRQRVTSHNLEMSRDGVGFTPRDVWNWGLKNSVMVRPVPIDRLRFALLPEDEATVRAEGIFFRGLYYSSNEIVRMQWLDQAKAELDVLQAEIRDAAEKTSRDVVFRLHIGAGQQHHQCRCARTLLDGP